MLGSMWFVPKKVGGRVCKYMHDARAIYNVLTRGRAVQKGGSNLPQSPGKSHPDGRTRWAIEWSNRIMISDYFEQFCYGNGIVGTATKGGRTSLIFV